jgi:CHAT domain-containing protein
VLLAFTASGSPLREAQSFFDAWARGDVASATAALEPAKRERFRELFAREHEQHCLRVLSASLTPIEETATSAVIEVDAVIERARIGEEPYAIELRPSSSGWRVVRFERREESLADAILRAGDREALLARHPQLITPRLASALGRRAILLNSRQRHAEALAVIAFARGVAERTGSDAARAAVLAAECVHVRRTAPKPEDAIPVGEEAERLALRSGDADAIAEARVRLARALEKADPARAEALLRQVVDGADATHDPTAVALAASQLAWMTGERLEHAEAFRFALVASRHAELSGDPSARLNAALNLAGSYDHAGDLELTRFHYERAAAVARESGGLNAELFALTKLAALAADFEPGHEVARVAAARELVACMGSRGDELAVPLAAISARAALRRHDLAAARREVNASLALRHRSVADVRLDAGVHVTEARVLLAEGKPLEALLALEEARGLVDAEAPDVVYEQHFSQPRARALARLGRRDEAIDVLREGIAIVESERSTMPVSPLARQSFFARRVELYDELVALLADAGRSEEALQVAEQRTARTLHELTAGRPAATASAGRSTVELERAERSVVELNRAERLVVELNRTILSARPNDPTLHSVRERLAAARLQLDDLRLRDAAHLGGAVPVSAVPLDFRNVPPRTAIVRYVVTDERTIAFVVTAGRVVARTVNVSVGDLGKRVEVLLERIRARDHRYRRDAGALHELLLAPLLGELAGVERVAVVADGPLWSLPFQTLPGVLARFELHYAPSVAWCLRDAAPPRKPRSILALGNPEISGAGQAMFRSLVPGSTLGQLPDAAREAREVARLYPRSRVLTGTEAEETSLKHEIARHDIVHLATHALIDETQPLYSGLVLARSPDDDGLLEARELESLDFGASLFVLSACSTARGRAYGGEGVVGLAWVLLSRGVSQVVVSQWNADSKATTTLMIAFHRFLVAGNTPAAALRKAQLELRKDVRYEDPLYWAAFVVIGES